MLSVMLCSCRQAQLKRVRVEAPQVSVKVMIVSQTDNVSQRSYVGSVQSAKATTISASYPGTLESVAVSQGMRLNAGDVIAVVNASSVQSTLTAARAAFDQASDGLDRAKKLYAAGSIPEVKFVEIQTKYAQAKASLDAATNAADECTLRAPYNCVVAQVYAHKGERVMPGHIVASIVDDNALEVIIPVPEAELASIPLGAVARVFFPSLPAVDEYSKSFRATVKSKGIVSDDLSHTFKCTLQLKHFPENAISGMACKVFFEKDDAKGIVVPADIVKMDDNGQYVWTVAEGVVQKKMVTVDGYSGKGVVIRSGLDIGDMVIVEGASKVSTGMNVLVK